MNPVKTEGKLLKDKQHSNFMLLPLYYKQSETKPNKKIIPWEYILFFIKTLWTKGTESWITLKALKNLYLFTCLSSDFSSVEALSANAEGLEV